MDDKTDLLDDVHDLINALDEELVHDTLFLFAMMIASEVEEGKDINAEVFRHALEKATEEAERTHESVQNDNDNLG